MSTGEWIIIGLLVGPEILFLVWLTCALAFSAIGSRLSERSRRRIDRIYDERGE